MIINRTIEFVAFPEGEAEDDPNSALTVADVRRFVTETTAAPPGTTVAFERSLYDGALADQIKAEWWESDR